MFLGVPCVVVVVLAVVDDRCFVEDRFALTSTSRRVLFKIPRGVVAVAVRVVAVSVVPVTVVAVSVVALRSGEWAVARLVDDSFDLVQHRREHRVILQQRQQRLLFSAVVPPHGREVIRKLPDFIVLLLHKATPHLFRQFGDGLGGEVIVTKGAAGSDEGRNCIDGLDGDGVIQREFGHENVHRAKAAKLRQVCSHSQDVATRLEIVRNDVSCSLQPQPLVRVQGVQDGGIRKRP
mmetsp:Transcript_4405/g.7499  ORF Transcript_4405/g.7499 Transcript_4405/m.7499 type:complete len:235 (-) Transcript_4405:1032-1736(-)